jgi:hypothetical protein
MICNLNLAPIVLHSLAHHLWQLEIAHVFNELLEFAEFSRDSDFAENDR